MNGRKIFWTIYIFSIITAGTINAQAANVPMNISLNLNPNQTYNVYVTVDPLDTAIAGMQLNIDFNDSMIKINDITEGDLFKQEGASTSFSYGSIDNSAGRVLNVYNLILGKANVSTPGTFIIINFTSIGVSGTSWINLSNVKLVGPDGNYIALNTPVQPTNQPDGGGSTSISGGGGGGSGGGGGAQSDEDFKNIDRQESRDVDIHIGLAVYKFSTLDILKEIGFDAEKSEGQVTAKIELLKARPKKATSNATGNVYRYFNVVVGTSGYGSSSKIKNSYIIFSVPDEWLKTNNADSVKLMKFKDNAWIDLKTEELSTGNYKAYTTGFSGFAIVAISETSKEITQPSTTLQVTEKNEKQEKQESSPTVNLFFISGVFFVLIIITFAYMKRGKLFKKN